MGYSYRNANSLATIYAGWYAGTSGGVQMEGAAADKKGQGQKQQYE